MSTDRYRLIPDREAGSQLPLELAVALAPPAPLSSLDTGDRFVLDGSGLEGKLVHRGLGSADVLVRRGDEGWSRTTWSLGTVVRRMAT
ncbi:MAG: hypothetical protein FJ206_02870 [Gemmatimonadetes bacterium]|nr:hypothetical protein [Gemmatimonadota bacterium]